MPEIDLDRRIRFVRFVELELARRYPTDVIKSPMHLSLGQEWVSVAVCAALSREHKVIGTYRSHALYLAKIFGEPDFRAHLKMMLAELYGLPSGCAKGQGGSMHLVAPAVGVLGSSAIVGTNIPVALGWAYSGNRTVCFFGDGATEEGAFYETVNLAVTRNIPLMFVCENNFLAVNTPAGQRSSTRPLERVRGFGIEINHAAESSRHNLTAITRSWLNKPRPLFVECTVERRCEHVGPKHDPKVCDFPTVQKDHDVEDLWFIHEVFAEVEKEARGA